MDPHYQGSERRKAVPAEYGLEVVKDVSACNYLAVAKSLLDKQAVVIHLNEDAPDKLYAEAICKKGNDTDVNKRQISI